MNVVISQSLFMNNKGNLFTFDNIQRGTLIDFFPDRYFEYSMSPMISIQMNPPTKGKYAKDMNFLIQNSKFTQNRNIQVAGLGSSVYYYGSLIEMSDISSSASTVDQTIYLTIQDCDIRDNQFTGDESSLIHTIKVLTHIYRTVFQNNGRISSAAQIGDSSNYKKYVTASVFPFKSYSFTDTQAHGCVTLEGDQDFPGTAQHEFVNNTFSFNFGSQGVAYTFTKLDSQDIYISGNKYSFMFAEKEGSILYWQENKAKANLIIERESAQFLFAQTYGAIRIDPIAKNQINVMINNSQFKNTYAANGQAMFLSSVGKVIIKNCNFTRPILPNDLFSTTVSSFKRSQIPLFDEFISKEQLKQFMDINQILGYIQLENVKYTSEEGFLKTDSSYSVDLSSPFLKYAEILNCNLQGNEAESSAAIYSYETYLRVANQLQPKKANPYFIQQNVVNNKGVITLEGDSILSGENLQFFENEATDKCSALYAASSDGFVKNSVFSSNFADNGATIMVESDSNLSFDNCTFSKNYGEDTSVLFAQNNPSTSINFTNSKFINNTAETNLINLLYSNAVFNNSVFIDNVASAVNHGITLISSTALMHNVIVNYTQASFLNSNKLVDTGFFNLNYRSSMIISNSTIDNCRGALASVMYITGQSDITFMNNSMIKNSISKEGQTIYATLAQGVFIDKMNFNGNGAVDLYLEQTPAFVKNSKFKNSIHSSIQVISSYITVVNSTFENTNLVPYSEQKFTKSEYGQGIYCKCNNVSRFINNTFKNLASTQGAALYLMTSSRTLGQMFVIQGNTFISNYAIEGGAIYLYDAVVIEFTKNLFDKNQALRAAAVFLNCLGNLAASEKDPKGILNTELCNVYIKDKNIFQNNIAQNGGAIMWIKNRPVIEMNSTTFKNNVASVYGTDIGSYPGKMKMVFLSNGDYVNPYNKTDNQSALRMLQVSQPPLALFSKYERFLSTNESKSNKTKDIGTVPPLVSGNKLDFNIYIMDQDGNPYTADSSSKASLDKDASNSPTIVLNNEVIAKQGVYMFRNVELRAQPGSQPKLNLTISGLETFGNNIDFADPANPIQIASEVRKCVQGEELTSDGRCLVCPEGTFQYSTPEKVTPCQTCPKDADCLGKTAVFPKPGYWRSSNVSSNFIKCPNQPVCLGGDEDHPLGVCEEGYRGIVCGDCSVNYSKKKQFECGSCPDKTRNLIQTIFILVGAVFYVAFLVRSTLNSATEQKSVTSVYMKIMTNHFQILGAISNIDYQWPSQIQKFQDTSNQASSATGQVFSFDCFLMGSDGADDSAVPVFFEKLIMFGLLPFIMMLVCLAFWGIVSKIQKKTIQEFRGKFISTLIVVLFLVHPDIAKSMFLTFNCVDIDGQFRMKENVSSVCYEGQHMFFISIVAFPSIGLWVFGIPLFAFLVLYKNRRVINLMSKKVITKSESLEIIELKTKYGFLFSGYDSKSYFWEVMIMYRKILIIMASVFLSTVSPESQVLVVIFIIVMNMFLQIRFAPFYTSTLNKMENYSLQVAAVTIYTGMYYVTGAHYTYMQNDGVSWFFLVCIVLPNLVFITYWVYHMRLEVIKIVYKKNLKPWMFKIVACQSPERFYELHIKAEEAMTKEQEQIIVEDDQLDLAQIELQVNEIDGKEARAHAAGDATERSKMNQQEDITEMDMLNSDLTGRQSRYKQSDFQNFYKPWESQAPQTARSFKVFPESVVQTGRLSNDFTNLEANFNTPTASEGEGPQLNHKNAPQFQLNNTLMLSKMALSAQMRQKKLRDRYGGGEDPQTQQPEPQPEPRLIKQGPSGHDDGVLGEEAYEIEDIEIDDIYTDEGGGERNNQSHLDDKQSKYNQTFNFRDLPQEDDPRQSHLYYNSSQKMIRIPEDVYAEDGEDPRYHEYSRTARGYSPHEEMGLEGRRRDMRHTMRNDQNDERTRSRHRSRGDGEKKDKKKKKKHKKSRSKDKNQSKSPKKHKKSKKSKKDIN